MKARSNTVSFGMFAAVALLIAVVVFLMAGGFFSRWDGVVTNVASPIDGSRTSVWVYEEGDMRQLTFPTSAVRGHGFRLDQRGIAPAPLPDDLPVTRKSRFTLNFIMTDPDRAAQIYATTSSSALAIAVLAFFLLLFGRNMVVSGSPFNIEPRPLELPKQQTPMGQVAQQKKKARSKKGPPPPNKRRRR
jgi:hypothetical protein